MDENSDLRSKKPSAVDRLAGNVDPEIKKRVEEYDRNTCGFHAKMICALSGGDVEKMGPNVRGLYDQLMADADEPPVAAENQIVFAFRQAMLADLAAKNA